MRRKRHSLYVTSSSVTVGKYEYPVDTVSYGLETVTTSVLVTRIVVSQLDVSVVGTGEL